MALNHPAMLVPVHPELLNEWTSPSFLDLALASFPTRFSFNRSDGLMGNATTVTSGHGHVDLVPKHHSAEPLHRLHAFACHPGISSGERATYLPFSSASRDFDLNPCFESLVVSPLPVVVFTLFGAVQAGLQWRAIKRGKVHWKMRGGKSLARNRVKAGLFGLAGLSSLASLILLGIFTPHHFANISLFTPFLTILLYPIMLLLSHIKHHTSLRSSSAILAFWPMYLMTIAVTLRTRITMLILGQAKYSVGEWVGMGFEWAGVLLGAAGWAVECVGPENGGIRLEEVEDEDEDGSSTASNPKGKSNGKHKTYQAVFHDDPDQVDVANGEGSSQDTDVDAEEGLDAGTMEEKILLLDDRESPMVRSNLYAVLTFSWLTPMMMLGVKRFLQEDDMWPLPASDSAEQLIHRLTTAWEYELQKVSEGKKKSPSLKISLWKAYGRPYLVAGFLKAIYDCLSFAQPQLLRLLLVFVQSYSTTDASGPTVPQPPIQGFAIALAMFLCANCATLLLHQYFDRCFATTMRIRGGLVHMVYKKSLNLSNGERSGRTTGDIINLQSVDATRIADLTQYLHIAWSGLFQIFLAFVSLYTLIGWQAFCGVAVMVVSLPVNAAIARKMKGLQKEQMTNKDTRTRLMNEILSNIKSIKLYGWEPTFKEKIYEVRNNRELKMLKKIAIYQGLSFFFWASTPFMVAFATFATFAVTSSTPLTSEKIFPAISLFGLLSFPLAVFSNIISSLIEALVSVARLETYFAAKELQTDAREVILPESSNGYQTPRRGDDVVTITGGEFKWNEDAVVPTLSDIDLSVKKGQLLALIGRVGTGKTSVLSAILGEMTRTEGSVIVRGEIAYFAQSSYVLSASVKENIVFGHKFDSAFYEVVLDACALRPDLAVLPKGDQTEVGEKGVSLSGGQKGRIALARAVYARADLYLLDDPLAAVDAHVGKHIFDNVIGPNGLLKSKARILCTNSITWLKDCNDIAMLRNGIILERGDYPTAMANPDGELYQLITGLGQQKAEVEEEEVKDEKLEKEDVVVDEDTEVEERKEELDLDSLRVAKLERRFSIATMRKASMLSIRESKIAAVRDLKTDAKPQEHREQGQVKRSVYTSYIKAASRVGFSLFLLLTALSQAAGISGNVVLRYWGRQNSEAHATTGTAFYLSLYGLVGIGSSMLSVGSTLILCVWCAIACSKHLHDRSFDALMRAPLSYFELTPQGRILNIFSRDMLVVDEVLVRVFQGFFRTLGSVVGVMVVVAVGAPIVLIAVIPLGLIYRRIMRYYLSSSRELKRLDAVTRSPIFSWFSESLSGAVTIRAYGQVERFISNNEARVDRNQTCYMPAMSVNRWLAIRLEALGSCLMFAAALTSVVSMLISKKTDAGLVGIVMSYVISVTGSLNWLVRSASEVENNIVSVERIIGYTELQSEKPEFIPENKPAPSWPQKGAIEFKHLSVRYRPELDFALRDVSFKIEGGERIGVVGRTGSGKSTTTLALFRIIEASTGSVEIDNIDISTIGLNDLRSQLSLIPQDPSLFEGTLRNNIDPLNTASDQEIWKALEQSYLKDMVVEKLGGTLDAKMAEAGSNFSSGEKQLVCFARALLRKTKILVLDEATSSIDLETDSAVQKILRGPDFQGVTTFTIAHRINTILDSDRVLVLDQGRVAEFDAPQTLLQNKESIFAGLCAQAGIKGPGEATPSGSRTPATPRSGRDSKPA